MIADAAEPPQPFVVMQRALIRIRSGAYQHPRGASPRRVANATGGQRNQDRRSWCN
jgi:hypothetical protein